MRDLNYQLKQLCHRNRDGSYATQAKRMHHLMLIANQLDALGFRGMNARSLKPKHVEALVKDWLAQELSVGTIKNRMAVLRWWAQKVDKQNVVARSNDHYGIPDRQFVTNGSKAKSVGAPDLEKIRDPYVRMSLELQQAFGLRREEAIKFNPDYADRGDHITLKASWTKGGKARDVPVRSDEQRAVLDRARRLAAGGSLIPTRSELCAATAHLRTAHGQCRALENARFAARVCAAALRRADRMEGAGRRRAGDAGAQPRAEGDGPACAADHQSGTRA